ncbi:MAG: restriction endonuclease subunit S [Clostridia bacterium]|nr:restriction endonuclease subunit S [Clostridia bacterium]
MARLGDIATVITKGTTPTSIGFTFQNEGINFVKIESVDETGNFICDKFDHISADCHKKLKRSQLQENDILFSIAGAIGRTAIVTKDILPANTNQALAIIRIPQGIINYSFLLYILQSSVVLEQAEKKKQGVAQLNLSLKDIGDFIIPDIPLAEQQEIVDNLNKVSNLISLRKQQLSKLDELVKSRFIEMFGNLVIGDKISENKHKVGEIASVTKLAGFEFTKYIQYKEQGDIIMLRGLNCKKGHLVLDDIKWIDKETSDLLPRSKLYYGDILMTYAGTIGDVAMVDADNKYHLAPNVAKITLTDKMAYNPVFVIHLFMYTNDYIMTFASVVAQASINMEKIRNFEYYFPSAAQQNEFAAFVEQTDKSKFEIQQSLEKLETLKKALMQKYFG